jgi:hypothetical protein
MIGNIYILSNKAFRDNYYKIGFTTGSVKDRAKQLYNTSTVFPFEIEYCKRVKSPKEVEKKIHDVLAQYRINRKREFFEIELKTATEILDKECEDFEYLDEIYNTEYYKEQIKYIEELKNIRTLSEDPDLKKILDDTIEIEENLLKESYCFSRKQYYSCNQGEYPDFEEELEELKEKIEDNKYFLKELNKYTS